MFKEVNKLRKLKLISAEDITSRPNPILLSKTNIEPSSNSTAGIVNSSQNDLKCYKEEYNELI
jgi:hypothetical protein